MSCNDNAGTKKSTYTGNQVGDFNHVGDMNYVSGGPSGAGIASGTTVVQFIPSAANRRPWLRDDAVLDQKLLDTAYPTIDLEWICDIELAPDVTFRVSDKALYVQDENGDSRFYDARAERAPTINVTVGEWLQANYEVSDVQINLNNRDGFYNQYLPYGANYRQWSGARVVIRVGFGELLSNYMTLFEGQITVKSGLETTRDTINIKAYDKLDLDEVPMPPRVFSIDEFPDSPTEIAGKPVPIIYGDWTESVPFYGAVEAFCYNANEVDPTDYTFKLSDIALGSIDGVYLHRGDRTATTAAGPILIAENTITTDLESGAFSIPADQPVLDQPAILIDRAKAGVGSTTSVITSDGSFNFITRGVKIGDTVVDLSDKTATVTIQNLKYSARLTGPTPLSGTAGNGIRVRYVYLAEYTDPKASLDLVVTVSGTDITVGIPSKPDDRAAHVGETLFGSQKASAIKSAIDNYEFNGIKVAANLVKIEYAGTAPFGQEIKDQVQTVPVSYQTLTGGVDGGGAGIVTAVANFSITISGGLVFAEGDEYTLRTRQYKYLKGDKITVLCTGKVLNNVSTNSLITVDPTIVLPIGITNSFDSTYWICDNSTQKLYNISFDDVVIKSIDYTSIDPSITQLSTCALAADDYIWLVDATQSKIFRFNHKTETLGLVIDTLYVTGIMAHLANISGLALRPDNKFWIVNKATGNFYLIDAFSAVNPFVVDTFTASDFDPSSDNIVGIAYDAQTAELLIADVSTGVVYRVDESNQDLIRFFEFTAINDAVTNVTGISVAQDGTIFILDQGNLAVYNYNDLEGASTNPAFIARDLVQKFGNHTYEEFDLSWNQTAGQLSTFKCRVCINKTTNMITFINKMLSEFNTVFHLRFGKYSLFYIHFDNFRTNGFLLKEKDIKLDTFKPMKEVNQYFNTASATYQLVPFDNSTIKSDTYVSPAAISFAGKEVTKQFAFTSVYQRADIDELMPLYIRLSTPEPEFVEVTFGFRALRVQMQDFVNVLFDGDVNPITGIKESGRRFNNIPCMVRKLIYDLDAMSISMKLWSLGSTQFDGYTPSGPIIGGQHDTITLSNIGRLGYISPDGAVTGSNASLRHITIEDVDAQNAETRTIAATGLAWKPGYKIDIMDGATKLPFLENVTIESVSGGTITIVESMTTLTAATRNTSNFINGGHFIRYSSYNNLVQAQRDLFASFGNPDSNYPTSKSQELADQRGGAHNFADGGQPYIIYPIDFTIY